nr:bestrophin family ion channel [uncultured Flavobacterium sp.]
MLVSRNIKISDIIGGTFTNTYRVILVSTGTYLLNFYVFGDHFHFPTIVPTVLGTGLAFFIGFNNNQAYDRWWEARKIWGGIVNDSRSFARMVLTQIPSSNDPEDEISRMKKRLINRHIAFLYLLKDNLRDQDTRYYLNYISASEYLKVLENSTNKHNRVLELQAIDLEYLYKNNYIDGFKYLEFNKMLINFTDLMGKSERIKGTVFPTTYRYYTYIFTWIFIITVTLVISDYTGFWSILYASLLGYVFLTIQALGQSLVNPFENIPTGISLSQITRNIERNLLEMQGEEKLPEVEPIIDANYVM